MPFEAYIGYLCNEAKETRAEIESGEPFIVELRDLDTFERKVVQAIVAEPANVLEDSDQLWVLDWIENRLEEPWSIRVLKELDEEEEVARADITESDRTAAAEESVKYGGRRYAGSELPDAMGQEEARKYYEHVTGKTGKK